MHAFFENQMRRVLFCVVAAFLPVASSCGSARSRAADAGNDSSGCTSNYDCERGAHCEDRRCIHDPGTNDGPCYGNGTCNPGLGCDDGRCIEPVTGSRDGPCYGNGTCDEPLSCEDGVCVAPPGANGGRCIDGSCRSGLECQPDCAGRVCGPDGCGGWCRPDACRASEFCHNGACEPLDEFCGERIHYTSVVDEILLRSDPRVTCDDPACTDPFIEACLPDRMLQCTSYATWWVRDVAIDPDAATIIVEIIPSTYSHGTVMTLRFDVFWERRLNVETACIWNEIARFEPADLPPGSRPSNPTTLSVYCTGGVGFTRLRVSSVACRAR